MTPVVIGDATLYCGDCREILPSLTFDVVVTDPPWDQARDILGSNDPRGLFASIANDLKRAKCVAVQLGCYTDPLFCAPLADMKYLHTCWLRYVPASYRGRILVESDIAYVYGAAPQSRPGRRVIPCTVMSTSREPSEAAFLRSHGRNRSSKEARERAQEMPHPMPRHLKHVRWLVEWHSDETDVVIDPLMGSGTTGVACMNLGRPFIGIEAQPEFFDVACERIDQAQKQARLFA